MRKVSFFWSFGAVLNVALCLAVPLPVYAVEDATLRQGAAADTAAVSHGPLRTHRNATHAGERRVAAAAGAPTQTAAVPPPVPLHPESKAAAAVRPDEVRRPIGSAASATPKEPSPPPQKRVEHVPLPPEVQRFCANSANAASDARVAWQAARLTELEEKLRQRIAELEAKRAEYEDWLHRHDEAMKEAKEDVVAIYSRMRPDSAAAELAAMDEVMAASVLSKLNPRIASAILAEMDPGRAARIANAMVGPTYTTGGKKS